MLVYYLERMHGTIVRLETKVNGVSDDVLSNQLDGKWSIKHNIGHLAEVEEISHKRIDEILNGVEVLTSAVVPVQRQDYNALPVHEVIHLFKKARHESLKRLESLTDAELKMSSLHPRLKVQTNPVDLAFFHAEHDDNHLVRINEILNALTT
jgi:hypothetical protein